MVYEKALSDPAFDTPGRSRGLISVFQHRYLLNLLIKKSTATRYYGSALGWIWSYIRPGMQFLMYYLVIGVLLGANRGVPWFPVYLFSGIVAVNLFSEVLRNTTDSIVSNKALVQKIYLPRELFPVAATGSALIHFLPQAAVLLIVAFFCGWTVGWLQVGAFILGVVFILVFGLGLGLLFGAVNALYRDARNLVDIILMFATWASPVLYSWTLVYERAPYWLYRLFMANPMTTAVELFHDAFWLPLAPGVERPGDLLFNVYLGIVLVIATLIIGQLVFRRLEGQFAQRL